MMILSLVNRLSGETVVTIWRKASNMTETPSPLINNLPWTTSNYPSTDVMKWVIMLDVSCYAKYAQFLFDKMMLEFYCLPQADTIFKCIVLRKCIWIKMSQEQYHVNMGG